MGRTLPGCELCWAGSAPVCLIAVFDADPAVARPQRMSAERAVADSFDLVCHSIH